MPFISSPYCRQRFAPALVTRPNAVKPLSPGAHPKTSCANTGTLLSARAAGSRVERPQCARPAPTPAGGRFPRRPSVFASLLAGLFVAGASAQVPDDRYRPDPNGEIHALLVQPDGRVLVGGAFVSVGGQVRARLARLNHDGRGDGSFSSSTHLVGGPVHAIARRSNGQVLIGGGFTQVGGQSRTFLAQLDADGGLDTSFVPPQPNDFVFALAPTADGRVLAGGQFAQVDGQPRTALIRLNANGSLDSSFVAQLNGAVYALAAQPDGRIVVGGNFTQFNGQTRSFLARLNRDGSLDASFAPQINGRVETVRILLDESVLIGGAFTQVDGQFRNRLARFSSKGRLDPQFNPRVPSGVVRSVTQARNGDLLVAGNFNTIDDQPRERIARLRLNGSVVPLSGFNVDVNGASVNAVVELPTGQVVFGGSFSEVNGQLRQHLARVEQFGELPRSSPATHLVDSILQLPAFGMAIAELPDESVLIGGVFTHFNITPRRSMLKLSNAGILQSFAPKVSIANFQGTPVRGHVFALAVQANQRVLIGGSFTAFGDLEVQRINLMRVLSGGALDTGFTAGATPDATDNDVQALHPLDNTFTFVGGRFSFLAGHNRPNFGKVLGGATIDLSYPFQNYNGRVRTIVPERNGDLLVAGAFTQVGNLTRRRLLRVSPAGGIDPGFAPNIDLLGSGSVEAVAVRRNQSILVAGGFGDINGNVDRRNIGALNLDGSLDTSFQAQTNGRVYAVSELADGRILMAGDFTQVNGIARSRLARLNADGSVDTSLPNLVFDDRILNFHIQRNGVLLLSGRFQTVAGDSRQSLLRLPLQVPPRDSFSHSGSLVLWQQAGNAPVVIVPPVLSISHDNGASWTEVGTMTRVSSTSVWRRSLVPPLDQHYLLRVHGSFAGSTGSLSRFERQAMLYRRDRLFEDGFQP